MSNQVFANMMEVSCKQAAGKSICAFPDVCMTPPQTPATPPGWPIPYPNTGTASDTSSGSSTVKISGQEVMLKNKSFFKKSMGDEAGCAPMKGVVTHKNMGKVYFTMWSMDVRVEGENVVRNLDVTTHNHASMPGNSPPWPYVDAMAPYERAACEKNIQEEKEACGYDKKSKGYTMTREQCCNDKACQEARKCMLVPYQRAGSPNCCNEPAPKQTAHHLIEAHSFYKPGGRKKKKMSEKLLPQFKNYDDARAPCVCATGDRFLGAEHGDLHSVQGVKENAAYLRAKAAGGDPNYAWNYGQARQAGKDAHAATFPGSSCNPDCIGAQLDAYHKKVAHNGQRVNDETPLRTVKNNLKSRKRGSQVKRAAELLSALAARKSQRLSGC
jgi:hypothetical protein